MGESQQETLSVAFDARVRLEFVGSKITSDAGLLAHRELDEKLGLTDMADQFLREQRSGRNVQHHLVPLVRQSVYSRLAGYPDTNDADRLARDPAMRLVVSRRASDRQAAARNTVGRFETEILSAKGNPEGLAVLNAAWVSAAMGHTKTQRLILDRGRVEAGAARQVVDDGHVTSDQSAAIARADREVHALTDLADAVAVVVPGGLEDLLGGREIAEHDGSSYARSSTCATATDRCCQLAVSCSSCRVPSGLRIRHLAFDIRHSLDISTVRGRLGW